MKWGIMATGNIAAKFAQTVLEMNEPEEMLVAVGSRNADRASAFAVKYDIPKTYGSYEELAADPEVEAIYIATPNNLHFENTMLCLKAGKHVLCEKPFTTNAEEAQILYEEADARGLFVMEAFWIRFLPLFEKLLPMIASKEYGELRHARCDYGFSVQSARRERKFKSELGGGALLDIGIYNLGFLYMVMGALPESFTSEVHLNEYGTDEFSVLQLCFPGGKTAHSAQSIGLVMERQAALYFDRATIYLPDFQKAFSMTVKPLEGESYTVECPPDVNGFEYEIREVTKCVRNGQTHSKVFRPQDSVAVLGLLDEIRKSWDMKFSFESAEGAI